MEIKTVHLTGRIILQYAEQGNTSGPVVICLHGYTDSWKSYQLTLPFFSPRIHAFALSQRGHGNSARPAEGYLPADFAGDVAQFMEQMEIDSAVIVGHSMGATIAQRFALDYPRKTSGLLLAGAFSSFPGNPGVAELYEAVSAFGEEVDPAFVEEFQRSTVARPVDETFMQTVIGESLKVPARVWKAALSGLMDVDYTEALRMVRQPVWLAWGDKDTFAVRKDQDRLREVLAGARLSEYTGTGHSVHWEEPRRFAREVEELVQESAL